MWVMKSATLILVSVVFALTFAAQGPKREPEVYEDNIADESSYSNQQSVSVLNSILPNNIFNNGKPFYVEKDPVSGQLNFNSKKTNDLETYINDELLVADKDKGYNTNDISPFKANFHDYLNLPVKYTSSKFVYPLVSSSYSNLKYQGNNKNFTSNHKNFTTTEKPDQTTMRPSTVINSPSRGGFKDNQTQKPTSYTLKPRPITSAPMKLSSSATTPSTTINTPKPTKSSVVFSNKFDDKFKPGKFNPGKDKHHPPSTLSPSTTTVTVPPTPRPLFFPTENVSDKSQSNAYPSTTFKPIPTTIPHLNFNEPSSTTPKADGSMSLSEFFNSIGVENPPNLPLDSDASTIIELNVNSLNGPQNPQSISIPPSTTFNIPKLPQVPHNFVGQQYGQQNGHQNYYQLYPQNQHNLQSQYDGQLLNNQQGHQQVHQQGPHQEHQQNHQLGHQQPQGNQQGHQESHQQEYQQAHQQKHPQESQQGHQHEQQQGHQQKHPQESQQGHQHGQQQDHQHGQQQGHQHGQQQDYNQGHQQTYHQDQQHEYQKDYLQNHQHANNENHFLQRENEQGRPQQSPQIQTFENILQNQKPVSNMNNIIISPEQDSATFVLGSQQAVGSSNENQFTNAPAPHVQYGTIIHEEPYPEFKPQGFSSNKLNEESSAQNEESQTQNFRFPTDRPIPTTDIDIALPQNQMVVFPPNEKMPVEFVNAELDLNIQKQSNNDNRVVFKNDVPEGMQPPNQRQPQFRPNFNRPPPPPPQFALNELMRKQPGGPNRLPNVLPQFRPNAKTSHGHPPYNKDVGTIRLPNGQIVRPPPPPHFRQPVPNQDIPPLKPQFNRRNPVPNQDPNRFVNKMSPAMVDQPNRRFYRVPPPQQMMGPQIDRIYNAPSFHKIASPHRQPYGPSYGPAYGPMNPQLHAQLNQPQLRRPYEDFTIQSINNNNNNGKHEQLPPQFENEDFYKRPPTLTQRNPLISDIQQFPDIQKSPEQPSVAPIQLEQPKLEQVVTLQMIQSKKSPQDIKTEKDIANPLYVVYPIKSEPSTLNTLSASLSIDSDDHPVVVGQRGEHPPLPPSEIDTKSDFQNTPFQIVHKEQEPILMAKDKPNQKSIRMHFPYSLVKPDPLTIAELDRQSHIKKGQLNDFDAFNTGEAPIDSIPKVINRGQDLHIDDFEDDLDDLINKETRRPIAIAYTPTQPPPQYYEKYNPHVDVITDDRPDEYPGYQKGDIDELGLPSRGEDYEQDFQAPFFPSVSLGGTVVKNEYEGWNVINPSSTQSTPSSSTTLNNQKNQINRSDNNNQETQTQTTQFYDVTTKKFNPDTFQPELEGGFRPIIPNLSQLSPQKLVQVTHSPSTIQPRTQSTIYSNHQSGITAPGITPPATQPPHITPPAESTPTTESDKKTTNNYKKSEYHNHQQFDTQLKSSVPSSTTAAPLSSLPPSTSTTEPSTTIDVFNGIETTSEKSFFESIFDFNLDDDYEENKARSS